MTGLLFTSLPSYFLYFYIYGCARDFLRIRHNTYTWLASHTASEKTLFVLGNNVFLFTGYLLINIISKEPLVTIAPWKTVYVATAVFVSEESASRVMEKLTVSKNEYALAAMMKGFLILVAFFVLYLPRFIL